MSRRRVADDVLAQWFGFEPVAHAVGHLPTSHWAGARPAVRAGADQVTVPTA